MAVDIEKLEQRIKTERELLKKAKKKQRDQLIKDLGTQVLKSTGVTDANEFNNQFVVVTKEQLQQQSETSEEQILRKKLTEIADSMEDTGKYWKLHDVRGTCDWLASFRTENQQANQ